VTKVRHLPGYQNPPFSRTAALAPRLHYRSPMNRIALAALLASCFSFGALGCSSTTSVAPRSPALAFAASASDVTQSCTPDRTQVIATHVVPKAGITAVAEGDRIGLRFATTGNPRVALALDPANLEILGGETPPVESAPSASRGPVQVELTGHRRLVAWTEGSVEAGWRTRVTTVGADGSSEAPVDFGYQGSAVGQPAVAVTRAGNGVVAFIESNGAGFQVVVTHVSCATP